MSIKRPISSQCSRILFQVLIFSLDILALVDYVHLTTSFHLIQLMFPAVNNPTLWEFCFTMIGRTEIEGSKKQCHYHALSLRVNSLQRMHILQQTRTWIILNNTNIAISILHNQYKHNSSRDIKCNYSIIGSIYNCSIWNNKGIEICSTNRAL